MAQVFCRSDVLVVTRYPNNGVKVMTGTQTSNLNHGKSSTGLILLIYHLQRKGTSHALYNACAKQTEDSPQTSGS